MQGLGIPERIALRDAGKTGYFDTRTMDSSHLRLKRARVANFKSLKQIELDHLNSLALFMGRNNAGKSNILDAFKFVADAAISFDHAFSSRGRKISEVMFRKREDSAMEFEFEFVIDPPQRAELIRRLFAENKSAPPENVIASRFLSSLTLKIAIRKDEYSEELVTTNLSPDGRPVLIFSVKGALGRADATGGCLETLCARCAGDLPAELMALESPAASNNPFRLRLGCPETGGRFPISTGLAETIRQQFAGLEWIDPLRRLSESSPIQGQLTVAPDASNLSDVLHWLYNNKPKQFRKIETEVAKLVPQMGRLYTPTIQNAATLGLIDSEDEDLVYSMDQMSFGTRSLVAIVTKVIVSKPGSWICVEEPETYLHPKARMGLFLFLRNEACWKRIFVATHSTFIAASCPIDSLFVVQRDAQGATVTAPVTRTNALETVEQLGIKPSFSFEADVIVFVEDGEDIPAYEAWAAKFGFRVKIQFIDIEGAATLHYFANARVATSRFVNTLVFVVFGAENPQDERAARQRRDILEHMEFPPGQIVTLEVFELEAFLLEPTAILKAFPSIKLSAADLEKRLAPARTQPNSKKVLRDLLTEYKAGEYDGSFGARIAECMEQIPAQVRQLFERIDTGSKPFWKI